MKIQWSSTAAQETMEWINRAERGLDDCLHQAAFVYSALAEANPDGENKALRRMSEQFKSSVRRIKALKDSVNCFERAVMKTDECFQDAESRILHLCDAMTISEEVPVYTAPSGYLNWVPEAVSIMPDMRINTAPLPFWFRNILDEENQIVN